MASSIPLSTGSPSPSLWQALGAFSQTFPSDPFAQNLQAASSTFPQATPSSTDVLSLSPGGRILAQNGIDLSSSRVVRRGTLLDFSLSMTHQKAHVVRADGQWDLESHTMALDFSFEATMTRKDPKTGEMMNLNYRFEFHLEAAQVEISHVQPMAKQKEKPELDGIWKIIDDILQKAGRKGPKTFLRLDETDPDTPKKIIREIARLVHKMAKLLHLWGKQRPSASWVEGRHGDASIAADLLSWTWKAMAVPIKTEEEQPLRHKLFVMSLHDAEDSGKGQNPGGDLDSCRFPVEPSQRTKDESLPWRVACHRAPRWTKNEHLRSVSSFVEQATGGRNPDAR